MTALKSDLRPANVADVAFGPGPFPTFPIAATAAQVNIAAMKRIECWIVGSSPVGMPRSVVTADGTSACDNQSFSVPVMRTNEDITLTMWRYLGATGTDDAWTLFDDTALPAANMFLVDCPSGFTGGIGGSAAAAGDKVDIYNVLIGARSKSPRSTSELQMFDVSLTVIGAQHQLVLT